MKIGAFEAKTHLSELLKKVEQGQCVIITRRGKPVAQLQPVESESKGPRPGFLKGKIWMADNFDAPLEEFKDYM